jgi:hypothetical protein
MAGSPTAKLLARFPGKRSLPETERSAARRADRSVSQVHTLLRHIIDLVVRDEARHVAFGVTYMEQYIKALAPAEVEDRARFAFEACRIMRERIVPSDVFVYYGFDPDEGRRRFLEAGQMDMFRNLLFTRIMPNLNRIGLLTDGVRPAYDELGLMQYAELPDDGAIDWSTLSAPLATCP